MPAGVRPNVINTEDEALELFTIYAPPQHKTGSMQPAKQQVEPSDAYR